LYETGEDGSKGVILENPTAFNVNEMVPALDLFDSNLMFVGGEDGGKSVVMIHACGDLEGARPIGSGLFVGGVEAAKAAVLEKRVPAESFKFFFNHVKWCDADLKGMLTADGGWQAVALSAKETPPLVLHNGESGLWERLRFRLKQQAS
jgi:hypothetical protein